MIVTLLILSLVGAVLYAVVGTLWYSNVTPMGKIHMQYLGFDKLSEEEKLALEKQGRGESLQPFEEQNTWARARRKIEDAKMKFKDLLDLPEII